MQTTNSTRNRWIFLISGLAIVVLLVISLLMANRAVAPSPTPTPTEFIVELPDPTNTPGEPPTRSSSLEDTPVAAYPTRENPASQETQTPIPASVRTLAARETVIGQTATPLPPVLDPASDTGSAFPINDDYGRRIGVGQILVRAPSAMQPAGEAKIRVEIEIYPLNTEPTLVPAPTSTPLEAALQGATPTAIPTITGGAASVDVYEFTSVQIDGLNLDRFNIRPDITNGVRRVVRGVRYSWQWSISPREAANGLTTDFEALIFAQRDLDPQTQPVVVTRIPFKIRVGAANNATSMILIGVIALVAVVGIGVLARRKPNWGRERIFISYRRADSRDETERIRDELADHFGDTTIFKDIGSIEYGEDYRKRLEESVTHADVVLVMIGTQYLSITDTTTGERRLFQPGDFVRMEVELALQGNKIVIPVLVDGASIPKADDLPPTIRDLTYRNALPIRPDPDFQADIARLIKAIEATLRGK
jgi:hypothetical protein